MQRLGWLRLSSQAWMRFCLGFSIWTLLGLIHAAQSYLQYSSTGRPLPWSQVICLCLSLWYAWAILAQGVYAVVNYYPFEQSRWFRSLVFYTAVGVLFAFVKMLMDYPIIEIFYSPDPGLMPLTVFLRMAFTDCFLTYLLIFWAIVGITHARRYYRQSRERELRTTQLEARLARAQLQLLRSQLHPHFLFNTLNAISALIHRDVDVADRMLARLGDLLRLTLENAGTQRVLLRQEVEFLNAYLEIEQIRFGARLHVDFRIDPQTMNARVPYLILQPIVENAIKHGIVGNGRRGMVCVEARRERELLRLEVSDNGPGLVHNPTRERKGIGLANTRARLQQLYGDDHRFEITNHPAGGVRVIIELPYSESSADDSTPPSSPSMQPQEA